MTPPRDAQATRDRILAAATDEFCDHGFAGARVDAIASRAGCNKALLYQHFGDKDALYREVLRWKLAEIARVVGAGPLDVEQAVAAMFDFHAGNPWLARLMQWEALHFGTGAVPNEDERRERLHAHVARIEQAQREGLIDGALDARQLHVTLMSLVLIWFTAPKLAQLITGQDPADPSAVAERRAHVLDVVRRIVEPRIATTPTPRES